MILLGRHRTLMVLALLLHAGLCGCDGTGSAGTLWTTQSLAQARQQAKDENRVLLVYATASWCGPCKHMQQTTWADAKVASWFAQHGVAYKFDVDEDRPLSEEMRINAMPTMIVFVNDQEFDRTVGARTTDELLNWLEGIRKGRTSIDTLRDAAAANGEGGFDMRKRYELASALAQGGKHEEATQEFLWLWKNMLTYEPSMVGVRGSFMASQMTSLVGHHKPAQEAFKALRDALTPAIQDGSASQQDVMDWVTLADVVGEERSLLEWFDVVKGDPAQHKTLNLAARRLQDLLVEYDRWADITSLYPDPLAVVRQQKKQNDSFDRHLATMDEDRATMMKESIQRMERDRVAVMYASLLAAGDDALAEEVVTAFLQDDDTPAARTALVNMALLASQPREVHLVMLDDVSGADGVAQLRREVETALAGD